MKRRILCSVLGAAALATVAIPPAFAGDEWCEDDPTVQLTLDSGRKVIIHVTNKGYVAGSSAARQADIRKAVASAQVTPVRNRALDTADQTGFTIYVTIRPTRYVPETFAISSRAGTRPRANDLTLATESVAEKTGAAGPSETPLALFARIAGK